MDVVLTNMHGKQYVLPVCVEELTTNIYALKKD